MAKKTNRLIATVLATVVAFVAAPFFTGAAGVASAAGPEPRIVLWDDEADDDFTMSKRSLHVIFFESSNTTLTNPAITVRADSKAVKVYKPFVEPDIDDTTFEYSGFKGHVVVKALEGSGDVRLKIAAKGSATIRSRIVSFKLDNSIRRLVVRSAQAGEYTCRKATVYVKRGKSFVLKPYAQSDYEYGSQDAPQYFAVPARSVKWKSSNSLVAMVSRTGKVTVGKNTRVGGKAKITASYRGRTYATYVRVAGKSGKTKKLERAEGYVKLLPDATFLGVLHYSLGTSPARADAGTVRWSSDDPKVATVNKYGVVRSVKAGITKIRAVCGRKSVTFKVKVLPKNEYMYRCWHEEWYEDPAD
jgi:hypothetical protein